MRFAEHAPALGDGAHADPGERVGADPVDVTPHRRARSRRRRGIRPFATLSVVVLPAPFGPSSATTLPAGTREIDAVQHLDAAVAGTHAAQLEQRHGSARHR